MNLETRMRQYETSHDTTIPPEVYMVARVDGRGFTRLTKGKDSPFDVPFDMTVRDAMIATTEHLMTCGFAIQYGYTQSDEISLLFHPLDNSFGRKIRKYISVLAGEASARFTLHLGMPGAFDARISQLPTKQDVTDYFRWRQEDAYRNALSSHAYWRLRYLGSNARQATRSLERLNAAQKIDLLAANEVDFNSVPQWQKYGIGMTWKTVVHEGYNPVTDKTVMTTRSKLTRNFELPVAQDYAAYIEKMLDLTQVETL